MSLFCIADLHLSFHADKSMEVFRGWERYTQRLEENWKAIVSPEDTVVLAGDISWAMKLEDTVADFSFLQRLPGQKLLLKGNHDYWWTTVKKMERFLQENGFDSLHILHNNSILAEGLAVCGTRSWMFDVEEAHDEKVMNRELGRLRASLDAAQEGAERVAFLHYPPVSKAASFSGFQQLFEDYGVTRVLYGHVHGEDGFRNTIQGVHHGVEYQLISLDYRQCIPLQIRKQGWYL